MPDDVSGLYRGKDFETAVPFALIAVGALSLLRGAPVLGLGLLGCWLYPLAEKVDCDRRTRRAAAMRLDVALADSFPASDPPSLTGITPRA